MRFMGWITLLASMVAMNANAADMMGTWKVEYAGPPRTGPKTVGSMILDIKVEGNAVTGMVRIGTWPGGRNDRNVGGR